MTITLDGTAGATISGDMAFNSGYGSAAVAYGCRAWVNFNGTGTVAIRASGNVTSITDNSTGNYTVNFTTALVDANYSAVAASFRFTQTAAGTHSTTQLNVVSQDIGGSSVDVDTIQVAVFR